MTFPGTLRNVFGPILVMIRGMLGLTWKVDEPLIMTVLVVVIRGVSLPSAVFFVENSVTLRLLKLVAVVLLIATRLLFYGKAALVSCVDVKHCMWLSGKPCRVSSVCTMLLIRLAVLKILILTCIRALVVQPGGGVWWRGWYMLGCLF